MSKIIANVKLKGGPGSGHHGHEGRPGEVGGSTPSGGGGKGGGQKRESYGKPKLDKGFLDEMGGGKYQMTAQVIGDKPTRDEAAFFAFDILLSNAGEEVVSEEGVMGEDIDLTIKPTLDEYGEPYADAWTIEANYTNKYHGFRHAGTKIGKFTFEAPYTRGSISGKITRQFGTFGGVGGAAGITYFHDGEHKGKYEVEYTDPVALEAGIQNPVKWFGNINDAWDYLADVS